MSLIIEDILKFIIIYFYQSEYYKELMKRLSISIFCENCLSDNVITESAEIYEEFGKQYPEFSE